MVATGLGALAKFDNFRDTELVLILFSICLDYGTVARIVELGIAQLRRLLTAKTTKWGARLGPAGQWVATFMPQQYFWFLTVVPIGAPATQRLYLKFSRLFLFAFEQAIAITAEWIRVDAVRALSRDYGVRRELSKLATALVREACSTCPVGAVQKWVSIFEFPFRDACLEARNEIRLVEKYLMLARAVITNGQLRIGPMPETWRLANTITDWENGQALVGFFDASLKCEGNFDVREFEKFVENLKVDQWIETKLALLLVVLNRVPGMLGQRLGRYFKKIEDICSGLDFDVTAEVIGRWIEASVE
jgi:hypothetical protein